MTQSTTREEKIEELWEKLLEKDSDIHKLKRVMESVGPLKEKAAGKLLEKLENSSKWSTSDYLLTLEAVIAHAPNMELKMKAGVKLLESDHSGASELRKIIKNVKPLEEKAALGIIENNPTDKHWLKFIIDNVESELVRNLAQSFLEEIEDYLIEKIMKLQASKQ